MSMLAGPVFAVAGVLGLAGVLKLARPETTAKAMSAAGLPGSTLMVRLIALTEIILAVGAIVFGTALTAALLAAYFLAFAGFTFVLVRRGGEATPCGCFGESESAAPTTGLHVVMNLIAAGLCAAAIVWPTGGIGETLADQPLAGIPFLALTALCGWLWYLGLTVFSDVLATGRAQPASSAS